MFKIAASLFARTGSAEKDVAGSKAFVGSECLVIQLAGACCDLAFPAGAARDWLALIAFIRMKTQRHARRKTAPN